MTDEQKKAAGERLAAARAKKKALAEAAPPQAAAAQPAPAPVKIMQKAGIVEDDPIIRDDDSNVSFTATAADPFMGAIIEDEYHYVKVAEHKAGINLPSNKQKFLRMGYSIAPARKSIRDVWDESQHWVMRIPKEVYDRRQQEFRAMAHENASSTPLDAEFEVLQNQQKKVSLADMGVTING
jgi:hypothetical protein